METDDGWRKIWAKLSGGELRDRLQYIVFLALNSGPLGPQRYSKVLAQLAAEADRRGKREMVYEAMPWVKRYAPSAASAVPQSRLAAWDGWGYGGVSLIREGVVGCEAWGLLFEAIALYSYFLGQIRRRPRLFPACETVRETIPAA